jgi:hypothetical protein
MFSTVSQMLTSASVITGFSLHVNSHIFNFDTKLQALEYWRNEVDKRTVLSAKLYKITASGLKSLDYVIM